MSHTKSRGSVRSFISLGIGLILIVASLLLWTNKQQVLDWIAYQEYQPTADVEKIVSRTAMTEQGKFYFYVSKPRIDDAAAFNKSCKRREANSAILGCYANNHIFVYDIQNPQLDGIKEVTSAHEMLHAVYQRLNDTERATLERLLEDEFQKIKDDTLYAERMAFYARTEAGEKYNELHSIIGTEVMDVSAELERHYSKYFNDRSAVVALHGQYASVFKDFKQRSDELLAELKALGPQIEADSSAYNAAVKQLNDDIQAFNMRATSGGFTSRAAFDSERAQLIWQSNQLDIQRVTINDKVDRYEKIRLEYNNTAASSNELYKSMDSKLAPTPSV